MEKRGLAGHSPARRYHILDFIEPLAFLPFGFLAVRLLEGRFDLVTLMVAFALFFLYLPALVVAFESPRQS
jgi:hypothetical protein